MNAVAGPRLECRACKTEYPLSATQCVSCGDLNPLGPGMASWRFGLSRLKARLKFSPVAILLTAAVTLSIWAVLGTEIVHLGAVRRREDSRRYKPIAGETGRIYELPKKNGLVRMDPGGPLPDVLTTDYEMKLATGTKVLVLDVGRPSTASQTARVLEGEHKGKVVRLYDSLVTDR